MRELSRGDGLVLDWGTMGGRRSGSSVTAAGTAPIPGRLRELAECAGWHSLNRQSVGNSRRSLVWCELAGTLGQWRRAPSWLGVEWLAAGPGRRLNCSSQGQRRGRCRVNRRAERVITSGQEHKTCSSEGLGGHESVHPGRSADTVPGDWAEVVRHGHLHHRQPGAVGLSEVWPDGMWFSHDHRT